MESVNVTNGKLICLSYSDKLFSDMHINYYHENADLISIPIVTVTWDKFNPDELRVIVWDETGNCSAIAEHTLSLKEIIKNAECEG